MTFRSSKPAVGDAFYDRQDEVDRLLELGRRLLEGDPAWLCVIGRRKVGKTSLLLEAARRLPAGGPRCAIIDVFEERPVSPRFYVRYALRVADALLMGSLAESLEALAPDADVYRDTLVGSDVFVTLPAQLRRDLLSLCDPTPRNDRIRLCLDLPERLAKALDLRLIVAIDEFQELASMRRGRHPDPMPLMRSLWQRHERVAYVISGSARSMLLELVTDRRSPFFQHFDLLDLGPLPEHEALVMLIEGGLAEDVARPTLEILGTNPFYLQIVGEELVRAGVTTERGGLKDVLQGVLFSRTGRLGLYFDGEYSRLVGNSATVAAALQAAADGPVRLTDIATRIGASPSAVSRYLERLRDTVVQDDDRRYRVADPLFAMWLRWRRPGGSVVPMRILGDEAEAAAAERLARMGFDLVYQSRASRGAFDLLATRGAIQVGVQVKRGSLPFAFSKDEWARMGAESKRLDWRYLIAVVDPRQGVLFLDPAGARIGRTVRLHPEAEIDNVLSWIDTAEVR